MIGRMQFTRHGAGRAALAVAVVAVVAIAAYFSAQALGLGDDAPALSRGDEPVAVQSDAAATGTGDEPVAMQGGGPATGDAPATDRGDPPVLTISVPEMCVTGQANDNYGVQISYDEDGNQVEEGYGPFYKLSDLWAVPLTWTISGGTAPFEVLVQGQSLLTDGVEPGSTHIYCAQELSDLEPLDPDWPHALANPSTVNPGPWTIEATVVDPTGSQRRQLRNRTLWWIAGGAATLTYSRRGSHT